MEKGPHLTTLTPLSQTLKRYLLLYILLSVCGFLLEQPEWAKTARYVYPWLLDSVDTFIMQDSPRSLDKGSSWPRDRTCLSCLAEGSLTNEPPEKPLKKDWRATAGLQQPPSQGQLNHRQSKETHLTTNDLFNAFYNFWHSKHHECQALSPPCICDSCLTPCRTQKLVVRE